MSSQVTCFFRIDEGETSGCQASACIGPFIYHRRATLLCAKTAVIIALVHILSILAKEGVVPTLPSRKESQFVKINIEH